MSGSPSSCFAGSKTRNTITLACVLGVFAAFCIICYGVFYRGAHPACFVAMLPVTGLAALAIVLANRHVGQTSSNGITIVMPFGKIVADSNQKQRRPSWLQQPDSKAE